ncbi:hypothetical protein [Azospirillum largimobile]
MTRRRAARRGSKPLSKPIVAGVPGYGALDIEQLWPERVEGDASLVAANTTSRLLQFFRARASMAILAKSGEQLLREMALGQIGPGPSGLEQVHVELLQAFALAAGPGRHVPASPNSMVRLWRLVERNLAAYLTEIEPDRDADEDAILSRRIRMRTVFYRNVFNSDDAADVVPALLSHMDAVSEVELGYKMSDFAQALFSILEEIRMRLDERIAREQVLREGATVDSVLKEMLQESDWARRMWRPAEGGSLPRGRRGWAGFQMAEMLCAPLFTFRRSELVDRFGESVTRALFSCALTFGSLSEDDLSSIYLANPIWARPFIALDSDTLILPIPVLIVSFPFAIVEGLFDGNKKLEHAYSRARTCYLEDDVERTIRKSLPSATVYRSVNWADPDTKVLYEHDIVAVLGMQVLIFEAKSGKLSPAARRGGVKSLKTNFEKLFIEPGKQASRLAALLASRRNDVKLVDRNGNEVQLGPSGPAVVHKFGVCIEQFASVTSSRRLFREIGLLEADQDWAPILTLGELRMISDHLDTEVSFLHYLTRRATADDVLDFVADEQDLLAMYLTNGFVIDARSLEGRQIIFLRADAAVRGRASPRENRREFATLGIALPPMWNLIAKEIYTTDHRHRFDLLVTILNQHPGALEGMAHTVRRWRSGMGASKSNTISSRMEIGDRVFVVAVHMAKEFSLDELSWANQSRLVAHDLAEKLNATDCVIILKTRRSKVPTFDGISFFRFSPNTRVR